MSARDTMREMVKVLIQEFHMDPTRVLGYSHDCSSVNTLAMETMELIFFRAEDWPCFSHTLDHVGDQFVHIHIDGFWHLWMIMVMHLKYSATRWWSKFDCFEQIAIDWAIAMPHVLANIVQRSTTKNSSALALYNLLTTNRRSKEDMIRLELAQLLMEALFSETTLTFLKATVR